MRARQALLVGFLLFAGGVIQLHAALITRTLGNPALFADGTIVTSGDFYDAVSGQAAPFNDIIGSDVEGDDFSASWTFSYGAFMASTITDATVTIGIWDHDSQASGNQVLTFMLTGASPQDLTVPLNVAFESHGGANGEFNIYTVVIPSAAFSSLAGGSGTFLLTLQGPGLGILGETPFNGAGLAFSTLDIATVPEPAGMLLVGLGFAALLGYARLRRA
jgi:hypothetical protein